ncbi:MAG: glycogen synthase GlgA [Candidatus Omnitrophica bacterium]|nr:glycogen synthase GlgA [Candidatus Omnitrophota bacterium]
MRIVFVSPEMVPFAKTGGLADVTGTLPKEIQVLGQEVICFVPKYKKVDVNRWSLKEVIDRLQIPVGSEAETGRVFRFDDPSGVKVYFIDQPEYFSRDELYGTPLGDYPDNDRRFVFFQRGVLEALKKLNLKPDVIHCHDWQAGLTSTYLKTLYSNDPFFAKTKSIFTIHNLAYQGNFPPDSLPVTGLSWDEFKLERLEFYGKVSFLKGGLVYSDELTTVSPRYAQEIQTKEFGCGMEGVLQTRRNDLVGIVNGIDLEEWNPEKDPDIAANFSARKLEGKAACKATLQKENRFKVDPQIPLLGIVTRLADQKGLDILAPAIDALMKRGVQMVLLGTGDEKYHQLLRDLNKKYSHQLGAHILFDAKMAKRIYAGSDIFLMPSRFEPCGLGQLISFRFGTVPLVRETGGLADTVIDFDPRSGEGNGFVFKEYETKTLLGTLDRALVVYEDPKLWAKVVKNGMKADFSWRASARKYIELYERVKRKPVTV